MLISALLLLSPAALHRLATLNSLLPLLRAIVTITALTSTKGDWKEQ